MFVRNFIAHREKWDHSSNATDMSTSEGSRYLKVAAYIGLKFFCHDIQFLRHARVDMLLALHIVKNFVVGGICGHQEDDIATRTHLAILVPVLLLVGPLILVNYWIQCEDDGFVRLLNFMKDNNECTPRSWAIFTSKLLKAEP